MANTAAELNTEQVVQEIGSIGERDGALVVHLPGGSYAAQRATSCLMDLQVGDLVLTATVRHETTRCYVLAVLEREGGDATRLSFDGDVELSVPDGSATFVARDDVKIVGGREINVVSGSVDVNALEGDVSVGRLAYLGRVIKTEVEKLRTVAGTLDMVVDRVTQRVKRSIRIVEQFDQVRAERIDYAAKQTLNMRGETTVVSARKLTKMDGEQIQLG